MEIEHSRFVLREAHYILYFRTPVLSDRRPVVVGHLARAYTYIIHTIGLEDVDGRKRSEKPLDLVFRYLVLTVSILCTRTTRRNYH